ncbi:MAG: hypothetical protein SGARI_001177 [Bacillariaceae sp.]
MELPAQGDLWRQLKLECTAVYRHNCPKFFNSALNFKNFGVYLLPISADIFGGCFAAAELWLETRDVVPLPYFGSEFPASEADKGEVQWKYNQVSVESSGVVTTKWGIKVHPDGGDDLQSMPLPTVPSMVVEKEDSDRREIDDYAEPPVSHIGVSGAMARIVYMVANQVGVASDLERKLVDKEELRKCIMNVSGKAVDFELVDKENPLADTAEGAGGRPMLVEGKRHLYVGACSLRWGGREVEVRTKDPYDSRQRAWEPRDLSKLPRFVAKPFHIIVPIGNAGRVFYGSRGEMIEVNRGHALVVSDDYVLYDVPSRVERAPKPYVMIDVNSMFCDNDEDAVMPPASNVTGV